MKIKEGSIVRGKVTGIQPYGAFVQLSEDCNGLIHISELSDGYVKDIRDFVHIGEFIDVKVLKFNSESLQASPLLLHCSVHLFQWKYCYLDLISSQMMYKHWFLHRLCSPPEQNNSRSHPGLR